MLTGCIPRNRKHPQGDAKLQGAGSDGHGRRVQGDAHRKFQVQQVLLHLRPGISLCVCLFAFVVKNLSFN